MSNVFPKYFLTSLSLAVSNSLTLTTELLQVNSFLNNACLNVKHLIEINLITDEKYFRLYEVLETVFWVRRL